MPQGFKLVTPPAVEPISLIEAKAHCRVEISQDDTLISGLISAARRRAERQCNRCFVTQTVASSWDRFPRYSQLGGLQYQSEGLWDQRIPVTELAGRQWPDRATLRLARAPVQSVSSVVYIAADGTVTTLDPSLWVADTSTEPARVAPAYGQLWPIGRQIIGAVTVTYVAGYGDASAVPDDIKVAIKLIVGHWYANRETASVDALKEIPEGASSILEGYWWGEMP